MEKTHNLYGDHLKPTAQGHGVDISSQRMDALDFASCDYIETLCKAGQNVVAVDLGGGLGAQTIRMAKAGARVYMVDVEEEAETHFAAALKDGLPADRIRFLHKHFNQLTADDFSDPVDVLYSQRAIHYVPYADARSLLVLFFNVMKPGGRVFISAAGFDTEYGKTYPHRDQPLEHRFAFVSPDMQEKHGILHKIVTYKEDDLATLLRVAGFTNVTTESSAFGNIKATASKPAMP